MNKAPPLLVDAHIHVGRFREYNFPPQKVAEFLIAEGVTHCVASATVAVRGRHSAAERDIQELLQIAKLITAPLLWVTSGLLKRYSNLSCPLAQLPYRGLKVHPRGNKWADRALRQLLMIADERQLPVLVHTGGDIDSDAIRWLRLLENHHSPVVLAHGRPLDQTIEVLNTHPCAYVDTAFMPISDIKKLIAAGVSQRILFGSDVPIDRCFRSGPPAPRYRARLGTVKHAVRPFEQEVFAKTALKIFFKY